jgi:hypothetical protein
MKKYLQTMPMYDGETTATSAPTEITPVVAVTEAPVAVIQGPTAAQLAEMTLEDLSKLKADIVAGAELAVSTVEQAIKDAETKAAAEITEVVNSVIAAEQTFCQKHAIAVGAINTWAAVIGGIVVLKLLGVI